MLEKCESTERAYTVVQVEMMEKMTGKVQVIKLILEEGNLTLNLVIYSYGWYSTITIC